HVDQVEDLQGGHQTHDHDDEQRGRNHRQRDGEELLDLGSTVQVGSLIQRSRNILQAGQQQHGIVTDVGPDLDDSAGEKYEAGVGQPTDIGPQHRIDNTILGVKNPLPHHGNGGGGHDHGQEEDGAEGGAAADLAVQQNGDKQRQEDAHGHRQDAEQDGVP